MSLLTPEQSDHYVVNGWLLCDDALPISVNELQSEVERVASLSNSEILHHLLVEPGMPWRWHNVPQLV